MRVLACLFASALLSYSSPAAAKIITITYAGTVLSGTDGAGLFGPSGANLTDDVFTVVYTFDDSLGMSIPGLLQGGTGAFPPSTSPAFSVELTINGQPFITTALDQFGRLAAAITEDSSGDVLSVEADSRAQGPAVVGPTYTFIDNNIFAPATVVENGPQYSGFSSGAGCVLPQNQCGAFYLDGAATYGEFKTTSWVDSEAVPVFLGSAVPEPSAWGMMLAGVAGVGAHLRRRKAVSVGPRSSVSA